MKFFLLILLVSFISAKRLLNTRHRATQQTVDQHKKAVTHGFSIAWNYVWQCDPAVIADGQQMLTIELEKLRDATQTSDCTGAINEVTNWWNKAYAENKTTWFDYGCLGFFSPWRQFQINA
jgi:hypothetical protein